jgi:hypothetical protein
MLVSFFNTLINAMPIRLPLEHGLLASFQAFIVYLECPVLSAFDPFLYCLMCTFLLSIREAIIFSMVSQPIIMGTHVRESSLPYNDPEAKTENKEEKGWVSISPLRAYCQ